MKQEIMWEWDGYVIRPARAEDAENYYRQNFDPLDKEAARLTGCRETFTKEEVLSFFSESIADESRCFFLILSPDGQIIGESVLNDMDPVARKANFRIGIFRASERGRGIGSWATQVTRDYAFGVLGLHRLELDVFSFNPRAQQVYRKAGFRREGVLRDAVLDGDRYADDILMAMLEDEWRELVKNPGTDGSQPSN
ncbi:MAG: GNAT family N-acetyltransferase [Eubacteriales bacterium]